jgi:dolichyl-phosphate-mannose--protein O-mannosyl transferase
LGRTGGIQQFFTAITIASVFLNDRHHTISALVLEGVCIGLACAVKFSAVGLLLFAVMREVGFICVWYPRGREQRMVSAIARSIVLVVVTIAVIVACVVIHLKILPFRPVGGPFCPAIIARDLIDRENPDWHLRDSWTPTVLKAIRLLFRMATDHFFKDDEKPPGIHVWQMPLFLGRWFAMYRGERTMLCLGNVLIWWPSVIAIFVVLVVIGWRNLFGISYFSAILWGYFASLLPLCLTRRNVYLTDYTTALFFALYLLVSLWDKMIKGANKGFVLAALAGAGIFGFIFWAPLIYGLEVKDIDFLVWNRRWNA